MVSIAVSMKATLRLHEPKTVQGQFALAMSVNSGNIPLFAVSLIDKPVSFINFVYKLLRILRIFGHCAIGQYSAIENPVL